MKWPLVAVAVIALGFAGLHAPPASLAACSPQASATDCDLQTRIAAADAYLATRPGFSGYVPRDRKTVATYRNSHADDMVWTGVDHPTCDGRRPAHPRASRGHLAD